MNRKFFTSESVTAGHPDKMCDIISDAILDAYLEQDPYSRVACETIICTGYVLVTGQVTTTAHVDIPSIVRQCILDIGYNSSEKGFDGNTCAVIVSLDTQSLDIAQIIDDDIESGKYICASNQGTVFGYATKETEDYMPYPIWLAHKLAKKLAELQHYTGSYPFWPDGKVQVTVEYDNDGNPFRIESIVVSTQHQPNADYEILKTIIMENLIQKVVDNNMIDENTKFFINSAGRFVIGGPKGDTGLTGRKIIVDTYGGMVRHGGGAFSGKDCTKIDRSAAYAARYIAKNVVAAGLADKCEIQLSYAIGIESPISICIDTFGTGKIPDKKILYAIDLNFNLTVDSIIRMLNLRQPIYKQTSAYGHFGRSDLDLPWERLNKFADLNLFLL